MSWSGLKRGRRYFNPSLTYQPRPEVEETLSLLPRGTRICDLGAGGRRITADTFTVDGFESHETDLVCDLHEVSLPSGCFDAIFCTGTLEHVADPSRVLSEMARLLVPGGLVHIEVPFIQGFHADPDDFWRWTLPGLRLFCRRGGFEEVRSGVHIGPSSGLAWVAHAYVEEWAPNGVSGKAMGRIARIAIAPLKYLDRWVGTDSRRHRVASGVFFVGRRPAPHPGPLPQGERESEAGFAEEGKSRSALMPVDGQEVFSLAPFGGRGKG